jgi:hypothetical protein
MQDFERFRTHFPENGDLTLQLLKGHLLVETALREIFEAQLFHPKALTGERGTQLTCHQIICLTEAITPVSQNMPWLWVALRRLNTIRNDLAHQLQPKDLEQRLSSLIEYVEKSGPDFAGKLEEFGLVAGPEKRVLLLFLSLATCLSALMRVVQGEG